MRLPPLITLGLLSLVSVASVRGADAPATEEDRLRGALRDTMLQLRSAQADEANLQAAQAADADEKKALAAKFDTLKRQVVAERATSDKAAGELSAKVADQQATIDRLNEALARSKGQHNISSIAARKAEALVEQLRNDKILLQRRVADLQAKNLALFLTGNDILSRYAEFSLGTALSAKEPFVSLTRTKLENLVQDYQDELMDQRDKQ